MWMLFAKLQGRTTKLSTVDVCLRIDQSWRSTRCQMCSNRNSKWLQRTQNLWRQKRAIDLWWNELHSCSTHQAIFHDWVPGTRLFLYFACLDYLASDIVSKEFFRTHGEQLFATNLTIEVTMTSWFFVIKLWRAISQNQAGIHMVSFSVSQLVYAVVVAVLVKCYPLKARNASHESECGLLSPRTRCLDFWPRERRTAKKLLKKTAGQLWMRTSWKEAYNLNCYLVNARCMLVGQWLLSLYNCWLYMYSCWSDNCWLYNCLSLIAIKSCMKAAAYVHFFSSLVQLLFKCSFYLTADYMQNPESAKPVKAVSKCKMKVKVDIAIVPNLVQM